MILDNRENEIKKMEDELEKFKIQLAKKDEIITRLNEKIETLRTQETDLKETLAKLRASL
jgi:chromosome segregation ATPase